MKRITDKKILKIVKGKEGISTIKKYLGYVGIATTQVTLTCGDIILKNQNDGKEILSFMYVRGNPAWLTISSFNINLKHVNLKQKDFNIIIGKMDLSDPTDLKEFKRLRDEGNHNAVWMRHQLELFHFIQSDLNHITRNIRLGEILDGTEED
ncbi:MAG: hypothetical protein SLAVMIC_00158 [uncultured marine phage]|uniref:Uncharacterized protein n=1 Tax=uncultured marine phage TaxID=707152 RepID=A0A8D9C8G0_9VIRU|nr:MAG: hypothetical protein SLAVMIC_00158 [uncultured marine phage]